jgi:Zn-dependent oligopeptidase
LFEVAVGVHGLCLLSGPSVGLDVRELSSHLLEHWGRHPAAIRVRHSHE